MAARILITGAAGNLGTRLARHLVAGGYALRLMYHRSPVSPDLLAAPAVQTFRADLSDPSSHLLSAADFLRATEAAIVRPGISGIYHVGDEHR